MGKYSRPKEIDDKITKISLEISKVKARATAGNT
jgi:hypothetical protein